MNKLLKRVISIFLIFSMVIPVICPLYTKASDTYSNYLALGDSIAYGYGLENIESRRYSEIVRSKLNIDKNNYKNMAISGKTCEEYYQLIQTEEYTAAIKEADLITISIGSNELLGIATEAMANTTGVSVDDPDFLNNVQKAVANASVIEKAKMVKEIYDFFTSEETKQKIDASIKSYETNWDKTVKYIKSVNPDVTIVATQFYNPYYEVALGSLDISGFVDESIQEMNTILNKNSNSEQEYKIAKIYEAFNTTDPRLTNVNTNFSSFSIDPHPNSSGHEIIAAKVLDCLKNSSSKTDIATLTISEVTDQAYTGNAIKPEVIISNGNTVLKEDEDYTLTYMDNVEIGEAKISITGIGNYSGNVIKTFNIKSMEQKDINSLKLDTIEDCTYTGIKITPDISLQDGSTKLKNGTDYILKYQNNINVGVATVIISGTGNYTGKINTNFNIIAKDIKDTEIKDIDDQKYTGSEIKPSVSISDGSAKLVENEDYTVTYTNNTDIGTAKIEITGKGNYTGVVEKSFNIAEQGTSELKDISEVTCTSIEDKIYTGKLITPEVTLTDGDKTLIKYTDYKLSYTNNINVGTATLTITGLGDYTGKVEKKFKIVQKDIKFTQIEDIADQKFTGNEIKPTVVISSDFIKLVEGQDYTFEYKNNIAHGTASIIITGKGNYKGSVTKTFNIVDVDSVDNEEILNKDESNTKLPQTGTLKQNIKIVLLVTIIIIIAVIKYKLRNKYKEM